MRTKSHLFVLNLSTILIAALLASCATPDPKFLANARNVTDTNYPSDKILGTWAHISVRPVETAYEAIETKVYFDFRRNGRGTVREAVRNKANGGSLSAEAGFTWAYLGNNRWKFTTPGTAAYRVTDSHLLTMNRSANKPPSDHIVRYYNGYLYDFGAQRVLVRATAENVSNLANRMRGVTPVLSTDREGRMRLKNAQ